MKRRDFVRLSGVGAGALLTGLYGCDEPIIPGIEDDPVANPIDSVEVVNPGEGSGELIYKNFKNKILSSGLERPSGISLYGKSSKKSSSNPSSLEEIIFCSGPLVDGYQSKFFSKPSVFNYEGNLNTVNIIYEFGEEDLDLFRMQNVDPIWDSSGNPIEINGEKVWRPRGISSDTVVLADSTILFSTNMSNKILDLTGGVKKIYYENDDLIGINNMIYSSEEDKIYFTQNAIRSEEGQLIRPKRVVSLDSNKNMNLELELPLGKRSILDNFIFSEANSLYSGNLLEAGNQIRIIENLDKKVDPSKFYFMDQLARAIYKNTEDGLVNILENSEPQTYPSGIAAEIKGKIYYVTAPVLYHPSNQNRSNANGLAFSPELRVFDPKKEVDEVLYTFEELSHEIYDSQTSFFSDLEIGGEKYILPADYLMTLGAVQVDNNLNIYYTDNISGEVGELSSSAE